MHTHQRLPAGIAPDSAPAKVLRSMPCQSESPGTSKAKSVMATDASSSCALSTALGQTVEGAVEAHHAHDLLPSSPSHHLHDVPSLAPRRRGKHTHPRTPTRSLLHLRAVAPVQVRAVRGKQHEALGIVIVRARPLGGGPRDVVVHHRWVDAGGDGVAVRRRLRTRVRGQGQAVYAQEGARGGMRLGG